MVVNEIAPKHLTGLFGSCHQLLLTAGIVLTAVIGMLLDENMGKDELMSSLVWRFGYAGPVFFSALQVLLLFFVYKYESPVFYILKNDDDSV